MKKLLFLFVAICFLAPQVSQAQKKKKKKKGKTEVPLKPTKSKSKDAIKKYSEVITKDAVSDAGLFAVHKVKKAFYYEIPFSLLNKEMLWVSRVAQIPTGLGGGYFNAAAMRLRGLESQLNYALPLKLAGVEGKLRLQLLASKILHFSRLNLQHRPDEVYSKKGLAGDPARQLSLNVSYDVNDWSLIFDSF